MVVVVAGMPPARETRRRGKRGDGGPGFRLRSTQPTGAPGEGGINEAKEAQLIDAAAKAEHSPPPWRMGGGSARGAHLLQEASMIRSIAVIVVIVCSSWTTSASADCTT